MITGGAGYIGSTVAACCVDHGIEPIVVDDLSSGSRAAAQQYTFYEGDCADVSLLNRIFSAHGDIAATVHCAGRVSAPESMRHPLDYYAGNVVTTIELARQLNQRGCRRLIFSSSAALYAAADGGRVDEGSPLEIHSPYAESKRMIERILSDAAAAGVLAVLSLRYFNPIGADPVLRSGPSMASVGVLERLLAAHHAREPFIVTGTDWPTADGSAGRDYVHVWDVALAHVAALRRFDRVVSQGRSGFQVINIGTGRALSVYELVRVFETVVGESVETTPGPARPGDVVGCSTRTDRAADLLGWRPQRSVADAVHDALAWYNQTSATSDTSQSHALLDSLRSQ